MSYLFLVESYICFYNSKQILPAVVLTKNQLAVTLITLLITIHTKIHTYSMHHKFGLDFLNLFLYLQYFLFHCLQIYS